MTDRDGRGSSTGLTDDIGALTDTYSYDAFGAERSHTGSSPNEFTYTGEQNDPSDLEHLRARYYDPATGRFLSQDPLPFLQRYPYVGNNPTNLVDPSGLCVFGMPCFDDAVDCALNKLDCIDPRRLADPIIGLLPEGTVNLPFLPDPSYQLSATCVQYLEACVAAYWARDEANQRARELYTDAQLDENKEGDAFQHCYWSGLITLQVGAGRAEKVTTRFEATGDNDPRLREFDLHNNARGREFAQQFGLLPVVGVPFLDKFCQG